MELSICVYILPRSSIAHFQTARLLTQHVSVAWELRHFVVFRQIIVFCCRFLPYIVAGFSPSVLGKSTSTLNNRRRSRETVFIHKLYSEDRNLYNTSGSDLRSLWSSLSSCEDHFHLHSLSAVHIMWFMSCTHHSTFLLFKWTRNCT